MFLALVKLELSWLSSGELGDKLVVVENFDIGELEKGIEVEIEET